MNQVLLLRILVVWYQIMIKIFHAGQVRNADSYTIQNEPISSTDLMERAAQACTSRMMQNPDLALHKATIICGPGNNGGDGLAIARLLKKEGLEVEAFIPAPHHKFSDDFRVNLDRLSAEGVPVLEISELFGRPAGQSGFIIDALFGSGLSKAVTGEFADAIRWINASGMRVVSIDIPSGLYADKPSESGTQNIVKADITLSFQFPKLAFFLPENDEFIGDWEVLPIGLHSDFIESEKTHFNFITEDDIRAIIKPRKKFSHKGTYGHALLIAGSHGKMGASVLASRACLRSGTGLLTTHIPRCGFIVLQTSVPEAMVSTSAGENNCSDIPGLDPYSGIGIGPGLGTSDEARNALRLLIQEAKLPLILDADAINILGQYRTWLSFLPAGSILTPHPGEFERLTEKARDSYHRLELLKEFCFKNNVFVVLKGAHSVTCTPHGNYYFNPTGNPGMATGGSGDVLTGIILSLLAQGYQQAEACILGVFLHGKAGDIAAVDKGFASLIAGDIVEYLPEAFKRYE